MFGLTAKLWIHEAFLWVRTAWTLPSSRVTMLVRGGVQEGGGLTFFLWQRSFLPSAFPTNPSAPAHCLGFCDAPRGLGGLLAASTATDRQTEHTSHV